MAECQMSAAREEQWAADSAIHAYRLPASCMTFQTLQSIHGPKQGSLDLLPVDIGCFYWYHP